MADEHYILEARNISKSFANVKVLTDVRFCVKPGEIHALMGENGAGKSTLMKIIMGIYTHDTGEILFDNKVVQIKDARDALHLGISMIHQELNPIPEMTVAENIFIGRESKFMGTPIVNKKEQNKRVLELLQQYNMAEYVSPSMKMKDLNIAQIQMMEIIKAVSYDSKVIIMDEPTSSLSEKETVELFKMIDQLKKNKVGIIYISHRMEEVFMLADRVTILRDGEYVGCEEMANTTKDKIIRMMVGRELSSVYPPNLAVRGDVVLEIKHLTKKGVFEDVSLAVHQGEILGLSGLVGAGRSEVMKAVVGFDALDSGEILVKGKKVDIKHPQDAKKNRIILASEDRKALGLVLCRSISENISLQNTKMFSRFGVISLPTERKTNNEITKKVTVKMNSISDLVGNLSGGNQQKVVLAKCLLSKPEVLIIDEPTRGIDIGAKAEIYKIIVELAKNGVAIIMISSELPELIGMSDRIIVMAGGRIKGEIQQKNENIQEEIMKLAFSEQESKG